MGHNINYDSFAVAVGSDLDGTDQIPVLTDVSGTPTTKKVTRQLLMGSDGSELTIASGAVTITGSYHVIDTEGDAASDDLATINGGFTGQRLFIHTANDGRDVVLKNGTGNIVCGNLTGTKGDVTLSDTQDAAELIYDGTNWIQLSFIDHSA